MRVLVATDGSSAAAIGCAQARALTATDSGSAVHLVAVIPPDTEMFGGPWPVGAVFEYDAVQRAATEEMRRILDREVKCFAPALDPTTALLRGRPADEILAEARRWGADLIVLGARGHGPFASVLLGSVSQEVVDHSPVPVLIARREAIRRQVIGVDGSVPSQAGLDFVAAHAPFRSVPSVVVGVTPPRYPWWLGMAAWDAQTVDANLRAYALACEEVERTAGAAASQLTEAGVTATCSNRQGDPADELIRAANEADADLIVVGSRGQTGLTRLVLGSVARKVLHHAACSVLVVHPARTPRATGLPDERASGAVEDQAVGTSRARSTPDAVASARP